MAICYHRRHARLCASTTLETFGFTAVGHFEAATTSPLL